MLAFGRKKSVAGSHRMPNSVPEKCAACGKSFEALAAEMRKGGNLMKAYKGQSSCCKRGGLKGHLKEVDWAAYRS